MMQQTIQYVMARFRVEQVGGMRFVHIPLWGTRKVVVMWCVSNRW